MIAAAATVIVERMGKRRKGRRGQLQTPISVTVVVVGVLLLLLLLLLSFFLKMFLYFS